MSKSPTFGFSAFLKLICANDKPQKTSIKERHKPKSGGYDFHKSLRTRIQKLASKELTPIEVLQSLEGIKNTPEKESAKQGLEQFIKWKVEHKGTLSFCEGVTFASPNKIFSVVFEADFVVERGGKRTAIHVWNTGAKLSRNFVLSALSLVQKNWNSEKDDVDDFAVLSLKDGSYYAWSEAPKEFLPLGLKLLDHLELQFKLARKELGLPEEKDIGDATHPDF